MLKWVKWLLKGFWYEMTVSYKRLPDLEDIPPSGLDVWVRHPDEPQPIQSNAQPSQPVEIKPVRILSVRERAQFHKMRLEVLQGESWLNSESVQHTEPIDLKSISGVPTQQVERDTEVTLQVPSIMKHFHVSLYEHERKQR